MCGTLVVPQWSGFKFGLLMPCVAVGRWKFVGLRPPDMTIDISVHLECTRDGYRSTRTLNLGAKSRSAST